MLLWTCLAAYEEHAKLLVLHAVIPRGLPALVQVKDDQRLACCGCGSDSGEDGGATRRSDADGLAPRSRTSSSGNCRKITALAPPVQTFRTSRDFAAWLGVTPLQRSTGGKQRLGATSKMGERTIRHLLIIGASAVVSQARRRGAPAGSWLARMLVRKPRMLVMVALANKTARIIWALLAKGEVYRAPAAVA